MKNPQSCVAHIDHIQIAAPEGCEPAAREFFGALLGMNEIENPCPCVLAEVIGCAEHQVHIGVERVTWNAAWLRLCRETVVRLQKTESALVRSLERDFVAAGSRGAVDDHSRRGADHSVDLGAGDLLKGWFAA